MRIQDVIKNKGTEVISVREHTTAMDAIRVMQSRHIGALVVLGSDGHLLGVMSEREVVSALALDGPNALRRQVRDLMLVAGPVVAPTDTITDAMKIMTERRARHLPVVSGSSVAGLISIGDAVKARLLEKTVENAVLQDIARWPRSLAA